MENTYLPPPQPYSMQKDMVTTSNLVQLDKRMRVNSTVGKFVIILSMLFLFSQFAIWMYIGGLHRKINLLSRSLVAANSDDSAQLSNEADIGITGRELRKDVPLHPDNQDSPAADAQEFSSVFQQQLQTAAYQTETFITTIDRTAADTKRRADLTVIGTALHFYAAEKGVLPPEFPADMRCIGTEKGCYNVFSYLIPRYMDTSIMDPSGGTLRNTKYRVSAVNAGSSLVKLEADGSDYTFIEVWK